MGTKNIIDTGDCHTYIDPKSLEKYLKNLCLEKKSVNKPAPKKTVYPINQPVWKETIVMNPFCPKCINNGKRSIMKPFHPRDDLAINFSYGCSLCGHRL